MRAENFEARLDAWYEVGRARLFGEGLRITVGMGSCGRAAGGAAVLEAACEEVARRGVAATVEEVGCFGMCWAEPLVEVQVPGVGRAVYGRMDAGKTERLVGQLAQGEVPTRNLVGMHYYDSHPLIGTPTVYSDGYGSADCLSRVPFYAMQNRRVTSRCGLIVPWDVEEYAACGGYRGLARALGCLAPAEVIEEVSAAGVRGRGGAGFPAGTKWRAAADEPAEVKYVVVNGDEGDPGAFMDRALLEGDPHSVIEGAALAGFAIGAAQGYVFTRREYGLATQVLQRAIDEAYACGLLGKDVLGSDFSFDLAVVRSAGAYVCGEATAMIAAMEGRPGFPRKKPPYTAQHGLWGAPTCVNNVETLCNVTYVMARGAQDYRHVGTAANPGTKVFSVAGDVALTGTVELPLGFPLNRLAEVVGNAGSGTVAGAGGSVAPGAEMASGGSVVPPALKAVQIGGPSGLFLPASQDVTLDFDSLIGLGGSIGSGGLVFLGERSCVVELAKYLTAFSQEESCGQCKVCKEGLAACVELLGRFTEGKAYEADLDSLKRRLSDVEAGSRCGLGRMAVRPAVSSLRFFEDEYRAHMKRRCPGFVCKDLIGFKVDESKCPGCGCCKPTCPTNAMTGRLNQPYSINERLCIRCWMCTTMCPYDAVVPYSVARA